MSNQTLIQYFHWYYNEEEKLWQKAANQASSLKEIGITGVWFPPSYKSTEGANSVGYDSYDLFDLGEFDQKNSLPTRYGTKEEYLRAISALHEQQIMVLADVVFNHKAGGDELEKVPVRRVAAENREEYTSEVFDIEAWTKFTFPGRQGKYSEFIWDKSCFSGIDWAEDLQETAIFSIQNQYGEGWEDVPSNELGNYDYLMFNDIEFRNQAVREELKRWGEWYYQTCGVDGFRLDAVKHIATDFLNEWLDHMKAKFNREFFIVAENWVEDDVIHLRNYIDLTAGRMQLFDSMLHLNFYKAGLAGDQYDLSKIFENTLIESHPHLSITFVDNHDSQPLQELQSYVDFWFRPIAYGLILLREQGVPCVFYPDIYGAKYEDKNEEGEDTAVELVSIDSLPLMTKIRRDLAYGFQRDYFDHPNCIGWTREGVSELEQSGIAVVVSNGEAGAKKMEIGAAHAGKIFIDVMGYRPEEVFIDENGWAEFYCQAGSISVWITKGI
ncbi:alpha-amylase [Pedobacter lusitanus]|uniref:Alpha-amylase n=1 Tax=Pedobacter lusitanus TaxID=1503925 RepID=A0A0D0F4J3_9SPHI|nr:alpha-amylase [Pedobacter lusitanus]KIO76548.1 alpha-amylase [Pedobacter lusitanus]